MSVMLSDKLTNLRGSKVTPLSQLVKQILYPTGTVVSQDAFEQLLHQESEPSEEEKEKITEEVNHILNRIDELANGFIHS